MGEILKGSMGKSIPLFQNIFLSLRRTVLKLLYAGKIKNSNNNQNLFLRVKAYLSFSLQRYDDTSRQAPCYY